MQLRSERMRGRGEARRGSAYVAVLVYMLFFSLLSGLYTGHFSPAAPSTSTAHLAAAVRRCRRARRVSVAGKKWEKLLIKSLRGLITEHQPRVFSCAASGCGVCCRSVIVAEGGQGGVLSSYVPVGFLRVARPF